MSSSSSMGGPHFTSSSTSTTIRNGKRVTTKKVTFIFTSYLCWRTLSSLYRHLHNVLTFLLFWTYEFCSIVYTTGLFLDSTERRHNNHSRRGWQVNFTRCWRTRTGWKNWLPLKVCLMSLPLCCAHFAFLTSLISGFNVNFLKISTSVFKNFTWELFVFISQPTIVHMSLGWANLVTIGAWANFSEKSSNLCLVCRTRTKSRWFVVILQRTRVRTLQAR